MCLRIVVHGAVCDVLSDIHMHIHAACLHVTHEEMSCAKSLQNRPFWTVLHHPFDILNKNANLVACQIKWLTISSVTNSCHLVKGQGPGRGSFEFLSCVPLPAEQHLFVVEIGGCN